jgi:hypothetical protein
MAVTRRLAEGSAMASRWRRRRMCILLTDAPVPAALRDVSTVRALASDGLGIAFDYGERSVAFALAAITADMSRPGSRSAG